MNVELLLSFLGWSSLINIALLLLSTVIIITIPRPVMAIHSAMFDLGERHLPKVYFQYIAQYKIAIILFNVVPYLALRIAVA